MWLAGDAVARPGKAGSELAVGVAQTEGGKFTKKQRLHVQTGLPVASSAPVQPCLALLVPAHNRVQANRRR